MTEQWRVSEKIRSQCTTVTHEPLEQATCSFQSAQILIFFQNSIRIKVHDQQKSSFYDWKFKLKKKKQQEINYLKADVLKKQNNTADKIRHSNTELKLFKMSKLKVLLKYFH